MSVYGNVSRRAGWLIAALLVWNGAVAARETIRGRVLDALTGEGLQIATIQQQGSYIGTITNDAGEFLLEVEELPVVLRASYIGYASKEVRVEARSTETLVIRLEPVPYVMEETIVTGEDPAVRIMREVIRRKQEWRPRIERFKVEAYARRVLENETDIAVIGEVASEIYWDRDEGFREIIKSRRATANMEGEGFDFGSTEDFVNLYDDDIEIIENQVIGPTHPDALHHYEFKLTGQRRMDDKTVYDISLRPKSRLQTAFIGHLSVLDEEFGLLEAELTPVETITSSIPVPIFERFDITYRQQFRSFADGVWLPVDFRYEIAIKIGMIGLHFPLIKVQGLTRLTDYQVDAPFPESEPPAETAAVPDTVFSEESGGLKVEVFASRERVRVDTQAVEADSQFVLLEKRIPLTEREQIAYATIDTNMRPEKAFKPTGFLTRFIDEEGESGGGRESAPQKRRGESGVPAKKGSPGRLGRLKPKIEPEVRFNRVEEGQLGLLAKKRVGAQLFSARGGYSTGLERWSYGVGIERKWGDRVRTRVEYRRGVETRYRSDGYQMVYSSPLALLGYGDYFDYLWREGLELESGYRLENKKVEVGLALRLEEDSSLPEVSDFDLLGRSRPPRSNPGVDEGQLRSLILTAAWGGKYQPFGIAANGSS